MQEIVTKVGIQGVRLTTDNIQEYTELVAGTFEAGILTFTPPSGDTYRAIVGDWLFVYDTGDVDVVPNYRFKRLYEVVDIGSEELVQ